VQNVVALLPGRVPGGPAVLVLSHYDSQLNGKFYALNNNSTNPLAIEYVA